MLTTKTFSIGGIHPEDHKELTSGRPLWNAGLPSKAIIPLQQHIGSPAECTVAVGDRVTEGQLIGKAPGFVSANVHASIPGEVVEIRTIFLPNGVKTQAVVIQLEGSFERIGKKPDLLDVDGLSGEQIIEAVRESGIVGMGGATFPTHVKLSLPPGISVNTLIINGAECEPYLTSDQKLMEYNSEQIVRGIQLIQKVVEPDQCYIGIEANKPKAIALVKKTIKDLGADMSVVKLKLKYPQGDEKQLVNAIMGKEIPSGALPLEIGAFIANVGTAQAIYRACSEKHPLIDRVVTVSGKAIRRPGTLRVRIGTTFGDLIEECGGLIEEPEKLIAGGPMMGFSVYDMETPVTKGTSGLLALTKAELGHAETTSCINCGRCVEHCPVGLEPTRLQKLIDHDRVAEAVDEGLLDCRECGVCSHGCPAKIPLVQVFRVGKRLARGLKKKS